MIMYTRFVAVALAAAAWTVLMLVLRGDSKGSGSVFQVGCFILAGVSGYSWSTSCSSSLNAT
jgi:hypothetical protein